MASETATSPEQALKHGGCGGKSEENSDTPAGVKTATKPAEGEKAPAPPKASGSCCDSNSHS